MAKTAAKTTESTNNFDLFWAILAFCATIAVLAVVIYYVKKKLSVSDTTDPPLTYLQVKRLYEKGQITDSEYERLKKDIERFYKEEIDKSSPQKK